MPIVVTDYVANGSFASLKANVTLYQEPNYAYFIRNTDLKSGLFEVFVDKHSYRFLSKSTLYGREIIISNVGDVGSVFLCPKLNKPMTLGNNIIMLRSEQDNLKYYLYIWFKWLYGQSLIQGIKGGSAQPKFNKTDFKNLPIFLPPNDLLEQFHQTVKPMFDLIEKNKNLEQQAQAIFKAWFVDFEPFNEEMPSDWIIGTVDDLGTEIICGKTPPTKKKEYYGGNTPFITIPDMHGCVYNVSTERYLSAAGVALQPKKTLPPNTVCVSCIGTAGLVNLVSEKSQSNQQINSIIPKEGISAYYIYLLMQTLSETINKLGQSGSTIVNLNKTQFGKIQVAIPSEQVLYNFDTLCKPLFEMILSNQKENIELANLLDALLPKLMSGELDVSDIDL